MKLCFKCEKKSTKKKGSGLKLEAEAEWADSAAAGGVVAQWNYKLKVCF